MATLNAKLKLESPGVAPRFFLTFRVANSQNKTGDWGPMMMVRGGGWRQGWGEGLGSEGSGVFHNEAVRFRAPRWELGSLSDAICTGKEPGTGTGYPKSNSHDDNDSTGLVSAMQPTSIH